jgi:hypothetical protein
MSLETFVGGCYLAAEDAVRCGSLRHDLTVWFVAQLLSTFFSGTIRVGATTRQHNPAPCAVLFLFSVHQHCPPFLFSLSPSMVFSSKNPQDRLIQEPPGSPRKPLFLTDSETKVGMH